MHYCTKSQVVTHVRNEYFLFPLNSLNEKSSELSITSCFLLFQVRYTTEIIVCLACFFTLCFQFEEIRSQGCLGFIKNQVCELVVVVVVVVQM